VTMDADLDEAAELLRVLGHAVRLKLLAALIDGERAVGDLETVTGVVQPTLSQQLGVLRKAALVQTRREAKQVFYRLDRDRIRDVSALIDGFAGTVAMPADERFRQRLQRGGSAAMFAKIG
jgi:DNA-binding transcriptional ArsR family regulator